MKRVIVAIPHSHSWFWTSTCVATLHRNPPVAKDCSIEIVMVDNSPWSPAIRGITDTLLGKGITVIPNHKTNRFHASALDCIVEDYSFDYLMALETDVMVLKPGWLQWFMNQLKPTDYAVGMWHHEQFVNPSCTLYRGTALRNMEAWCKRDAPQDELRWGESFSKTAPLDHNLHLAPNAAEAMQSMKQWIGGPFAEKRGFPEGTILRESPSGQLKGPGWYEPGQQLHHWAVQEGYTYTVCPTMTTSVDNVPVQTLYGATMPDPGRQLEAVELFGNALTAHLWGGTRALDILKHPVTCQFVKANTPGWLAREARFWWSVVPYDIRMKTLDLIRHYGWHITGQGTPDVTDRDVEAAEYVKSCYKQGGVDW